MATPVVILNVSIYIVGHRRTAKRLLSEIFSFADKPWSAQRDNEVMQAVRDQFVP